MLEAEAERNREASAYRLGALFVGFAGGCGNIIAIPAGEPSIASPNGYVLGTMLGMAVTKGIINTMIAEHPKRFQWNPQTLNTILESAIPLIDGTGLPIQMWKVTPKGAKRIP
jgi:hypothetical protein